MSTTIEQQAVDTGWHQIHRYAYVARPYDDVWAAVAGDRTLALPEGIVEGGVARLPLRVRLAGVEVTRPVIVHQGGLVVDGERSRLALSWFDKGHRNLFPVLEADLKLAPADFRGSGITQIGLVGRYRPPFGAFGNVVDHVAGAEIVAGSVMRFVQDVARRIEVAVPPAPISEPEPGDGDHAGPASGSRRVLLPVDGLAWRPGGAVEAREHLAAAPGVMAAELDPIARIATVDYDPERCTAEDLRLLLEADADR